MFTINLINESSYKCGEPLLYKLIIQADFNTAYMIRASLPKYIYDKDETLVIKTEVYADHCLVPPKNAGTGDDFRVSYLYNVTPECSHELVYKLGISSTKKQICAYLSYCLPAIITSTDGTLTIKLFQYYNKCLLQNSIQASAQNTAIVPQQAYANYGYCNRGCGGCGGGYGCGGGLLFGGLALLALCCLC